MINAEINYCTRDIIISPIDLKFRSKNIKLDDETTSKQVFFNIENYRTKYCDMGSWCYSKVQSNRRKNIIDKGKFVDISSFKQDRVKGVKVLIEKIINSDNSPKTIIYKYKEINTIFDYINKNYPDYNCSNIADAKDIFHNYSKYLINIITSRNLENNQHQVFKQEMLALFLSSCCQTNINYFFKEIRKIYSANNKKQMNKDEISTNPNTEFKILSDIFEQIYNFLINDNDLPLIIDLTKFGLPKAFIDLNLINKTKSSVLNIFYNENGIAEYDEFNKKLEIFYSGEKTPEILNEKRTLRKRYMDKVKRLKELNKEDFTNCNPKILLFNFVVIAFAKLLIAASGANESTLYHLRLDSFKTISTRKGRRAYNTKKRARGKKISVEFYNKFDVVYKKFVFLRRKINKIYKDKINKEVENLLLIKLPIINNVGSNDEIMASDDIMFEKFNRIYKELFKKNTIINQDLRKNFSNTMANKSNSYYLMAMRLGNTPSVANKHYIKSNFTQTATQITNYFENFDKLIAEKGRNISIKIPVHMISTQENSSNNLNTPVGHCLQKGPERAIGFNEEILEPICGNLNTCFFCESYIVHINKNDIKKILSLKYILEFNSHIKEYQKIIIYRINEIIELILDNYKNSKELIDEVQNEVRQGYLDEYWNNHLTMLFDLGRF